MSQMTTGTPLTKTTTKGGKAAADCVCAPNSSGVGVGSTPGISPGPAEAGREAADSARTPASASVVTSFLMDSPSVPVRAEIARKSNPHYNPFACPRAHEDEADGLDADRALFVRLYREDRLEEARAFCASAVASLDPADSEGMAGWACNLSMLARDAGDYGTALALLLLARPHAEAATPLTLAKYHNGLGRTYELLGRKPEALGEYSSAIRVLTLNGYAHRAAHPILNIGRVKASEGLVDEARGYLCRAAQVATESGDFRLLGEIAEEGAKL